MDDFNDEDILIDFARLKIGGRLANEPAIWRLKINPPDVGTEVVKTHLRQYGYGLKTLKIKWPREGQHPQLLAMVVLYCPNLETFIMDFDDIDDAQFEFYRDNFGYVFSRLSKLEHLALTSCRGDIDDEHLYTLPVETLKSLSIFCSGTPHHQLSANISRFWRLQNLYIANARITEETLNNVENLQDLIFLHLLNCDVTGSFSYRISHLQNLEELSFVRVEEIHDEHISAIARGCSSLRSLTLCELPNLTDSCFEEIGQLPDLEFVLMGYLPGVTNRSILNLQQIDTLQLARCSGVTNAGLQYLVLTSDLSTLIVRFTRGKQSMIRDINQAVLLRDSGEKFVLDVGRYSGPPIPNLSPFLSLEEWVMMS